MVEHNWDEGIGESSQESQEVCEYCWTEITPLCHLAKMYRCQELCDSDNHFFER